MYSRKYTGASIFSYDFLKIVWERAKGQQCSSYNSVLFCYNYSHGLYKKSNIVKHMVSMNDCNLSPISQTAFHDFFNPGLELNPVLKLQCYR